MDVAEWMPGVPVKEELARYVGIVRAQLSNLQCGLVCIFEDDHDTIGDCNIERLNDMECIGVKQWGNKKNVKIQLCIQGSGIPRNLQHDSLQFTFLYCEPFADNWYLKLGDLSNCLCCS